MPGTVCSSLPGCHLGGTSFRTRLEPAPGRLAAGRAAGLRRRQRLAASWHHSWSSDAARSSLPYSVCWSVCSGGARTLPQRGGQFPWQGEAEELLEEERGERVGAKRIVRNGTNQRSSSMKFISVYYLLPLFPALVFSARWVPRAILLRVLLFCLLFAFLDSGLSREITQISAFTGVVSLEQVSSLILLPPPPDPLKDTESCLGLF